MEKNRVNKRKKKNRLLKIYIGLLVAVLVLEVILVFKFYKSSNTIENEIVINSIKTPMVDFVYGFEAVDTLKVNINNEKPYDVTFLADIGDIKNIEILKFYFGEGDKGTSIGIINDNNGKKVKVSVEQIKFDNSLGLDSDEEARLSYVQDELLDITISNFDIVEYASEDERLEEEYILTETPYLKIPFSREWEEYLVVEQVDGEPYKVVFSCRFEGEEPVELFTYSFGVGVEDAMGYLNDIPVGLSIGIKEANENWKLDDKDIFYTMREEMNCIIDYLISTGEFVFE